MPLPDTPLRDGDWYLSYPGVGFLFETYPTTLPYFLTGPPELGEIEITSQDQPMPGADGVMVGRDTHAGRTVVFELGVNRNSEADALAAHAELARAWRGDGVRTTPGKVAELYVRRAGRQRVVYGRPRKFATALHMNYQSGYSGATAEFACVDGLFYDAVESSVTVSLVPPPAGGLVAPLVAPLATVPVVVRPGLVTTGGLVATWPVITIRGPVTSPVVRMTGLFTLAFNTTLAYDQTLTIDTRPWARTVLRNDGATFAGRLTKTSTPLSATRIPPQTSTELVFSGVDLTGTSTVTVAWRDAYPHL